MDALLVIALPAALSLSTLTWMLLESRTRRVDAVPIAAAVVALATAVVALTAIPRSQEPKV